MSRAPPRSADPSRVTRQNLRGGSAKLRRLSVVCQLPVPVGAGTGIAPAAAGNYRRRERRTTTLSEIRAHYRARFARAYESGGGGWRRGRGFRRDSRRTVARATFPVRSLIIRSQRPINDIGRFDSRAYGQTHGITMRRGRRKADRLSILPSIAADRFLSRRVTPRLYFMRRVLVSRDEKRMRR